MAPWLIESEWSGTTRSGSISCVEPRPWQAGQAPCGLLNEKMRGWISGMEMPHARQANFSEKVSLGPSASSTSMRPSDRRAAVSMESVRRRRRPSFMTRRSTTTEMSCLYFLSSTMSSSKVRISLSTSTRVKPSSRSSRKSWPYSPLRPRTTGAFTLNRAPVSSSSTWSMICSSDCPSMGRPQLGQCGWPIRA